QFEQQQQLKAIPIVALTAYVKAEQYKHCLEVGMNDFLSKPLTAQTLKACLLKNIGVDKTA
ncbi:MAG TPA: response regulator, partial [Agitococcus sp.]|nr:response regulator [Agitococcus sp.]HNL81368.1 response regulator [Agitococcus sp.]